MNYKKIQVGMIGGGPDSMIGPIHRYAMQLANQFELVAGLFSRDYEKSLQLAHDIHINPQRVYSNVEEFLAREKDNIDVFAVLTPNYLHYQQAEKALRLGKHLILEKPITCNLDQAHILSQLAKTHHSRVLVNYSYSGYPMVKHARYLVSSGLLGNIRRTNVEFQQGWLAAPHDSWRTDPEQSGEAGTLADIGTHAFHLAEYITGLRALEVCADIQTIVPGRKNDDDVTVLIKYDNASRGLLLASQVATGEEANLNIRIYGEKGALHWSHGDPNSLWYKTQQAPMQCLRSGKDTFYLDKQSKSLCRTPAGHPEGFIGAIANHYNNFANALRHQENVTDYPGIEEGVRGMAFIESSLASHQQGGKWVSIPGD